MKIYVIGDIHIKSTNLPYITSYIESLKELINPDKGDMIVVLGDVLHDHNRLHTQPLNKAYELINLLSEKAPTYVLVGNHDMINNSVFLTEDHWMTGLKNWPNVTIADKVKKLEIEDSSLIFVPYVPPGRFIEALNTINDWESASLIFAHQEFKNCQMGAIKSEIGDDWPLEYPQVFSGHIHERQELQENIFYVGSSTQVHYDEKKCGTITVIDYDLDGFSYDVIDLKLPRKRIIHSSCIEFESINIDSFTYPEYIKLKISGTYIEFKKLQKSKKYKDFVRQGVKIVYHFSKEKVANNLETYQTSDFTKLLMTDIQKSKDSPLLNEIYKTII